MILDLLHKQGRTMDEFRSRLRNVLHGEKEITE